MEESQNYDIIEMKTKMKEIKYIYHMADIHIRKFERQNEYNQVFNELYKELRKEKEKNKSIICILGDLMHDKLTYTAESVEMETNFLQELSNIMPVIIINGNHDKTKNNERNDMIGYVVKKVNEINIAKKNKKELHHLTKTGIYKFGENIYFGHTETYDDKYIEPNKIPNDRKKIFLYHGMVNGAKIKIENTKEDFQVQGKEMDVKKFEGYDLVLLGDIHSKQFLKPTICYPGSLIQQDYSETYGNKGIIKWNLENMKSEFIKIKNEYGYLTLNVKNGEIEEEISEYPKICNLRLMITDTDKKRVDEIHKKMEEKMNIQKYGEKFIKNKEEEKAIEEIMNINTNDFMFKYLKKCKMEEKEIDELMKIYDESLKEITEKEIYINCSKWKIKNLKFKNIGVYRGEYKIDFDQFDEKVVHIVGENFSGKSTILEVILMSLFGKSINGNRIDLITNGEKKGYTEIKIEMNSEIYTIRRNIEKNERKFKETTLMKETKDTKENLTEDSEKNTDKKIEELFGKYDILIKTLICLQNGMKNDFTQMSQEEQKKFLDVILRTDVYDKLYEDGKIKYKKIKTETEKCKKDCEKIEETIQENINYDEEIKKCNKEIEEKNKEFIDVITVKSLNQNKINVLNEKGNLNRKEILEKDCKKIKMEIEKKETIIDNYNKKIKPIKEIIKKEDVEQVKKENDIFEKNKNEEIEKLEKERDNYLIKYIDEKLLKRYEQEYKKCDIKIKEYEKNKNTMEIRENIEECKLQNDELIKKIQTKKNEKKMKEYNFEKLKKIHGNIDKLRFEKDCECCKNNEKIIKSNAECLDILNGQKEIDNLNNQIKELDDRIDTKIDKEYNLYQEKKEYEENLKKRKDYSEQIESMKNIKKENEINSNKINNIKIEIGKIKKVIDEEKTKFNSLNYKFILMTKIDNDNNHFRLKIQDLAKEKEELECKQKEKEEEIGKIPQEEDEDRQELEKYKKENIDLEMKQKSIKEEITKKYSRKNYLENKQKEKNENDEKLKEMKKELKELLKKKNLYEKYKDCFDKRRDGIQLAVIKNVIPIMNNMINDILRNIVNFEINIKIEEKTKIVVSKSKKTGNKKENEEISIKLIIEVIEDGKEEPIKIQRASGFQSFIFGLSLRIALTKFTKIPMMDGLIVDEGFSCSDEKNLEKYKEVFNYLKSHFKIIIIISHLQTLKDQVDKIINIKVDNTHTRMIEIL